MERELPLMRYLLNTGTIMLQMKKAFRLVKACTTHQPKIKPVTIFASISSSCKDIIQVSRSFTPLAMVYDAS